MVEIHNCNKSQTVVLNFCVFNQLAVQKKVFVEMENITNTSFCYFLIES